MLENTLDGEVRLIEQYDEQFVQARQHVTC